MYNKSLPGQDLNTGPLGFKPNALPTELSDKFWFYIVIQAWSNLKKDDKTNCEVNDKITSNRLKTDSRGY